MCGITGIVGLKDIKLIKRMTHSLAHRGPDDEGFFLDNNISLGHRRLSIIDLNKGKQPIFNEDKRIVTIFNGEIYNFKELRKNLEKKKHEFYTDTDTEVIVHLYEEYGVNFAKYLEGMFAIAVYDIKKKRLILVRDHVGIKPLYFIQSNKKFIFGSEIKALLISGLIKAELDFEAFKELSALDYSLEDRTFFKGIKRVLPGQIIILEQNKLKKINYDNKRFENKISSSNLAKNNIINLLEESVESRLMSDVPLGTLLSGGVDSSIIASMHRKIIGEEKEIQTFNITDDEGCEDTLVANKVAEHINSKHHEFIFNFEDILSNLPEFVYHYENIDYSPLFQFFLSKQTKKHATVVLSGNGADEVFGGYTRYGGINQWKHFKMISLMKTRVKSSKAFKLINSIKTLNDMLRFEQTNGQLSNCQLHFIDHVSMASAVEVRVPFLDRRLMSYANRINEKLKINKGLEKYILREAISDLNLPKNVIERKKTPAGRRTAPKAIAQFTKYCEQSINKRRITKFHSLFKEPGFRVCFDLFKEIFIENKGSLPKNLSISDLY